LSIFLSQQPVHSNPNDLTISLNFSFFSKFTITFSPLIIISANTSVILFSGYTVAFIFKSSCSLRKGYYRLFGLL
jgi:hypothetical protein